MTKHALPGIASRNRVIRNILEAITGRDGFLVMGHKNPDEDCIASMIAVSLILNKLSRTACLLVPEKISENFRYLLNICRYNSIELLDSRHEPPPGITAIFFMDTPKPGMRESFPGDRALYDNPEILKIEIDHHLEADSEYIGDPGLCLVDEASSAGELVGLLAFKLRNRTDIMESYKIEELFSRNFVLAVLTGIIGDSKMGKYLKTSREKWFYRLFSTMFNDMLASKTHKDSRNFSTMNEVFTELQQLSRREDECFSLMIRQKSAFSPSVGTVIIPPGLMKTMRTACDHETIVTVARYTADYLAEESRRLGLVAYCDDQEDSGLVQFRVRRSHLYKALDLRNILDHFRIENGGGHPGAIGFRLPAADITDIDAYVENLVQGIETLMEEAGFKP